MKTARTIAELRALTVEPRVSGATIGLVPTMGAFHDGHLALMRRARAECTLVVVSLFVNPTQFNDQADLAAYPRDEARDASLAEQAGVDILLAPNASEMYPDGYATHVVVEGLGDVLEGAVRGPKHFRGVATVVAKLFNIVQPHVAYFGQKDAQQVAVIQRMVRDLSIPTRIEVCPTVREHDGLARSSRNARLDPAHRTQSLALRAGLDAALDTIARGERGAASIIEVASAAMRRRGVEPEYVAAVSANTLAPMDTLTGDVLIAIAARVDGVRLIDNERVFLP
jgi:pantoate--beta-alanine ligase